MPLCPTEQRSELARLQAISSTGYDSVQAPFLAITLIFWDKSSMVAYSRSDLHLSAWSPNSAACSTSGIVPIAPELQGALQKGSACQKFRPLGKSCPD